MATLKQKIAVEKLAENPRTSVSAAMRQAGYAPITTTRPADLTDSKGFKELMKQYNLTPDRYIKKLDKALDAQKWNDFTGEREDDFKTVLPYHTKLGKMLGMEKEDTITNNVIVVPILGNQSVQSNNSNPQDTSLTETN